MDCGLLVVNAGIGGKMAMWKLMLGFLGFSRGRTRSPYLKGFVFAGGGGWVEWSGVGREQGGYVRVWWCDGRGCGFGKGLDTVGEVGRGICGGGCVT